MKPNDLFRQRMSKQVITSIMHEAAQVAVPMTKADMRYQYSCADLPLYCALCCFLKTIT